MKKYLMIGFAAVAFAACSNHDFETYSQEQIIQNEYKANFIQQFGQPASNQDWGFGASTRAFTRTWNVNGNQWHNELNLEYDVPVTTEEMNMVFNYVNNKNNVETVEQITLSKYWVAQIWNGKDDENAEGVKAPASISYPDQNGATTTIIGGGQMDKLEILEKAGTWTHCNNFNGADNNDWKEGGEGGRTLMVESGTLSFRYTNSQSSYLSEKYIIVPGEKIHSSLKGRYYVCFDFERGYTAEEEANEKTMGSYEAWNGNNYQGGFNFSLDGFLNEEEVKAAIGQVNGKDIQNINIKGYMYGDKHCDGDDNYTDWIVRITPAKVKGRTYEGRIMVEDLSAQADVTGKNSDWDFNDVVFDWAIVDGKAYIKLLAAGGTLPIRIGGHRSDNSSEPINSFEIHSADGLGGYMKNCGVGTPVAEKEIVLEDAEHPYTDAKNILITVYKGGSWVEIQAEQGQPAAKFNCKVGTRWCDEYVNIQRVYPNFTTWVANPSVDWTQGDGSTSRLTDKDLTNNAAE